MSVATPFNDEQLREFAQTTMDLHDPAKQQGEGQWPDRCAHCHYTRHPCDTFDLAAGVLRLLDRLPAQDTEGRVIITKTGRVMTEGELTALAEEALRHNVVE